MFHALAVATLAARSRTNWKVTRPAPAVITTTAPIACAMPKRRAALKSRDSLVAIAQLARLFRQHNRHAVADRVGEAGGAADQLALGPVEFQGPMGHRADQDLQEARVDLAFLGAWAVLDGRRAGRGGVSHAAQSYCNEWPSSSPSSTPSISSRVDSVSKRPESVGASKSAC